MILSAGSMSSFENVVGGKLKLKGKALDVKTGGMKKKKKHRQHYEQTSLISENELSVGCSSNSRLESFYHSFDMIVYDVP